MIQNVHKGKTDRSSFLNAVLTKGSVAYKAPPSGFEGYSSMVLENNGTRLDTPKVCVYRSLNTPKARKSKRDHVNTHIL